MVLSVGVVIRPVESKDLEQVVALNRACLPENYSIEFFKNLLENYGDFFLGAEEDERIIGYVMCRIELGVSMTRPFGVVRKGHVISLAVDKMRRRRGISYNLMQEVLRRMRAAELKECFLEVRVNNDPAIKLYEKLGFRIARRIPSYYSDGTDGYIMVLQL
ncbi:MAG: ribosomal protein S18-alanine N-acetyltransferase [Thermoproteota archaeon]